jgi:hypothetical protein
MKKGTKGQDSSKKEVKMVELKSLADMTDEEIDEYAGQIWDKLQAKKK